MKQIFTVITICWVLYYLAFAFITLDLDFTSWSEPQRIGFIIETMVVTLVVYICIQLYNED